MNLLKAKEKIRLYRRLNEQDLSFRHRDFDNYNEFFTDEKLDSFQETLLEYEQKKVSQALNPENQFFALYGGQYIDKYLAAKVDGGYRLHFEFNHILFYELFNFFKEGVEKLITVLKERFWIYYVESKNAYYIPYNAYQDFFSQLGDEDIKEAIRFLVRTVTYTVVSDEDQFETKIDIGLINRYLSNLDRYISN